MVLGSALGTVGFALWAGKLTDLHLDTVLTTVLTNRLAT